MPVKDGKYHKPISDDLNQIGKEIVDSAYKVHKNLGPGLLERIYEVCFCHELSKKGIDFERQADILIKYDGLVFDEGCTIRCTCRK